MISDMFDKIYGELEKCLYSLEMDVEVNTELKGDSYPQVVVDEIRNDTDTRTTEGYEGTDVFAISVDIYCNEKEVENTIYSGRTVARYIMKHIDYICCAKYRLNRKMTVAPNVDDSIYRINLRYTGKISTRRNVII